MPALAIGDVIEVSFRGTLFGQRILNILHYVVSVTGAGQDNFQLEEIAQDMATSAISNPIIPAWLASVGAEYTMDEVRAQRVYPTRTIYQRSLVDLAGTHADPCLTANIAVSIQKRGLVSGRTGNGRMQLGGIPRSGMVDGSIDVAGYGALVSSLRNALALNQTTSVTPVTIQPCIFNPLAAAPKYQLISSWLVQTTLRTMHRRTLLVGE